jgi:FtsP/CotA-like multicopper oxidase with cupredoxin domain
VNTRKLINLLFSIVLVASMMLSVSSQASAKAPTPPAPPKPPAHVHKGKITPADRQDAAKRMAKAMAGAEAGISAQAVTPGGTPDYFSFTPNYSISPIPPSVSIIGDGLGALYKAVITGGAVTGFTMVAPGAGYTVADVSVIGGGGSGGTGTATIDPVTGGITSIAVATGGLNYNPNYGIKKFVDKLPVVGALCPSCDPAAPQLAVATPTPMTVNGIDSDFYEIHLVEHTWQFSSSLPPTTIRSYVQYIGGVAQPWTYLGPIIVAQAYKPARIKFINDLPTGTGGDLFIPVDTSVMGAGMGPTGMMYTQNRAELHLHGGATPWISDGTAHQWTTPLAENADYPQGVSVRNVPDMDGGVEPVGTLTYYYTNQQSARLMFYHDHAYGITRLNVYAGEAAGYVVQDAAEQALVNGTALSSTAPVTTTTVVGGALTAVNITDPGKDFTSVPLVTVNGSGTGAEAVATMSAGKITNITVTKGGSGYGAGTTVTVASTSFTPVAGTIPAEQIPLVFQDKGFVDPVDIHRSDPTWNWGVNGLGDLWYPHVYMPNQNPYDLFGANATGRWDWGPWFWPPFPANNGPVANPYYDPNSMTEGPTIPSTPNPSLAPEGFMDTSLVNGKAYPVLNVARKPYRLRMLNASNDRYLNLSLFCAKSQATTPMWDAATGALLDGDQGEVNMVPAIPGAGLPASWPTDGRDGGVPDPLAAGPSWIVIGTEGGLMPAPTVIAPTPVGYEYNRRSITVLNVFVKALYLGPAERADVIVDFSTAPAGCNRLIVYNDAPAPMPAFDPRNDYYTGDPDNTPTGGAPSTLPGYGPNTRTMMQIVLDQPGTGSYNMANLNTALPKAFAASQDAPIIPEPAFNAAMGYTAPLMNYVRIQDTSFSFFNGPLTSFNVLNGGMNYTLAGTSIAITGGGGTGAQIAPVITPFVLTGLSLTNINPATAGSGSGYTSAPAVTFTGGGGGSGAAGTTTITKVVRAVTVTTAGTNYTAPPAVSFTGGGGTGAVAHAVMVQTSAAGVVPIRYKVGSVVVDFGGSGFTSAPTVVFTGGGFSTTAKATAAITGVVKTITLTNPGSGYQTLPVVTLTGGGAPAATVATAALSSNPNVITGVNIINPGANYTSAPTITITGGNGAAKIAAAPIKIGLGPKAIQELWEKEYGRMNATLGVEMPNTNGVNQTTIPLGMVDPVTEILQYSDAASKIGQLGDGTQIWKVTHNGVDSHPVHFHMFNVQLINRVGWDGMVKPPDDWEVGWKDTLIMNPLEDAVVAIRAIKLSLPWDLPNSVRYMDPASAPGTTTQFWGQDPAGLPVTVVNSIVNYGWEYTWHCHILGHEENDFMRPMVFAVPPVTPTGVTLTPGAAGSRRITVSFTDASLGETGFVIQRAPSVGGLPGTWTTVATRPAMAGAPNVVPPFTNTGLTRGATYFYRVYATNVVGSNVAGYPMVTVNSPFVTLSAVAP